MGSGSDGGHQIALRGFAGRAGDSRADRAKAKAVREEDRTAIRADHDSDILMFDVPPPSLSRGLDAYMATWETFFSAAEKPVAFSLHDVEVSCGEDVGFATAV